MKTRASFTALLLSAAVSAAAAPVTTDLFVETFSNATGKWSGSSGFKSERTWTTDGSVYGALGGAKLGTGSKTGTITSEPISLRLADAEATLSIHVQAAGYPGKSGQLSLTALDEAGNTLQAWTTDLVAAADSAATDLSDMANADSFDFDFKFETSVPFKLSITTGGGDPRVLLGEVRVSETYDEEGDEWEPEWTVASPSHAPTVGTAFSFAVSAALSDGTAQTVLFGGLQPAAAGTQPAFDGGVFSWTPDDGAAGDYVATFSVENDGGSYATTVAFTVADSADVEPLFEENFSGVTANNWTSQSYAASKTGDTGTWTGTSSGGNCLASAKSAIIVGRARTPGLALSPEITLARNELSAAVRISFEALAYDNPADSGVTLSIVDLDAGTTNAVASYESLAKIDDSKSAVSEVDGASHSETATAPERFKLLFATSGYGRVYLDTIVVVQPVDSDLEALPAPVPEFTDTAMTALSAGWTAVPGAAGYAVELRDASGTRVSYDAAVAASVTSCDFADLPWDNEFTLRVKALGDGAASCNSPWSEAVSTNTLENPGATVFTISGGAGDDVMALVSNKTFTVAAARANGSAVTTSDVALEFSPAAAESAPSFADGVFSWIPADGDAGKTFTATFSTDRGYYSTNVSFRVVACPGLKKPELILDPVEWNSVTASWDVQPRATNYSVRGWSGAPNPNATATMVEEPFADFADGVRPAGWVFKCNARSGHDDTPVSLNDDKLWLASYDMGGPISSVSFKGVFNKGGNNASVLRLYATTGRTNQSDWVQIASWTAGEIAGTKTVGIPPEPDFTVLVWQYEKDGGNAAIGSVVIEGSGFATPKWLSGWGPEPRPLGLVYSAEIARPRPGRFLGTDPETGTELSEPRPNYVELAVQSADGAEYSVVKTADVPAPPRSVRATLVTFK